MAPIREEIFNHLLIHLHCRAGNHRSSYTSGWHNASGLPPGRSPTRWLHPSSVIRSLHSTHLGFNHHTELSAHVPGIYRLDCRLIILRELAEIHHLRLVQQFPPVQVCPVIRREISEEWMSLVDGSTRGMRRTHLKPTGVPEHRQIGLLHIFAPIFYLSGSQKQHLATLLQPRLCLGIRTLSNINIP